LLIHVAYRLHDHKWIKHRIRVGTDTVYPDIYDIPGSQIEDVLLCNIIYDYISGFFFWLKIGYPFLV